MELEVRSIKESVINGMVKGMGEDLVKKLSKRFDFNYEEGLRAVNLEEYKVKSKEIDRSKKNESKQSKIPIPFCVKELKGNCMGIRLNHGLFTQCGNKRGTNGYCATCGKQAEKNTNGEPTYGTISQRIAKGNDFRDPKGKLPIQYGNIMQKLNITREQAEEEAARQGVTIPEREFEIKKAQRGRPKKDTSAIDTSEEDTPKKQRGRPKKEKKTINNNTSTELTPDLEFNTPEKSINCNDSSSSSSLSPETDSDEEETAVKIFKYNGKKYLKADDNTIYDFNSHEEIGSWNDKTKSIQLIN